MRRLLPLTLLVVLAGSGCVPALLHVAIGTERGVSGLVEGDVVVDGLRHRVLTRRGRGDGPTAVLLHGYGGDKDNWTRLAPHLPDEWHLVVPDLAGFGESERQEAARHDIVAQAERIHRLIQLAPSRPVILVGNSMGGHIAAATAILHPEDVFALVLLDPAGVQSPILSPVREAIARGEHPLLVDSVADFKRVVALNFVTPPQIPDVVIETLAERAFVNRPFTERISAQMAERPFPLETRLKDIRAPTLIVWGRQDQVLHESAGPVFAAGITDARLVLLEGTGHLPMIERPVDTARAIVDIVGVGR